MPPRKSNVSQATGTDDGGTPVKEREGTNIEDLSLPRTMVQRLAKGVLPPNTSLHKDAILALSKGATVFINYLAQAANEANATTTSRKNIPPGAVLEALHDLEFEDFIPRVEAELRKYNETQTGKRNEYRKKVKEGKLMMGKGEEGEEEGEEEGGRAAKRVRRGSGDGEGDGEREDDSGLLGQQLGVGVVGDEGEGYGRRIRLEEGGDEEFEGEEGEGDVDVEEREGGGGYDLRERKEEEESEEEEEEEDDEDTYPDEGRRLSSIEAEAEALEMTGREPMGSSADEEGSGSGEESY